MSKHIKTLCETYNIDAQYIPAVEQYIETGSEKAFQYLSPSLDSIHAIADIETFKKIYDNNTCKNLLEFDICMTLREKKKG